MRKQRYHGHLNGFFPLAVAVILIWGRWRPFRVEVEGDSMSPTLVGGEWLLAVRARRIRVGMVVVVDHPERPGYEMVKRVAAIPGERVAGRVLGPNEFWVTGDNEGGSTDSRSFGPIVSDAIRGRVVIRYWPLGERRWLSPDPRVTPGPMTASRSGPMHPPRWRSP